jgi:hypothetical protein
VFDPALPGVYVNTACSGPFDVSNDSCSGIGALMANGDEFTCNCYLQRDPGASPV